MKKIFFFLFLSICIGISCNNNKEIDRTDPLESGREFIDAALKGDYVRADKYMLKDSLNEDYMDGLKDFNEKLDKIERDNYREANIIIDSVIQVSDSVNIIYFANTYKKEQQQLKLVRENKDWWVDFKYTFNHNSEK